MAESCVNSCSFVKSGIVISQISFSGFSFIGYQFRVFCFQSLSSSYHQLDESTWKLNGSSHDSSRASGFQVNCLVCFSLSSSLLLSFSSITGSAVLISFLFSSTNLCNSLVITGGRI
jgi:hypothetical protein